MHLRRKDFAPTPSARVVGSPVPSMSSSRLLKALAKLGVEPIPRKGGSARGKGSHTYVVGPTGLRSTVMDREHAPSEVKTVLRQLGINVDDFLSNF